MHRVILLSLYIASTSAITLSQCANNNSYWIALNPTGPGNTQTTNCIWGGEYVTVNVCAGATYTFQTCGSTWDTQITVYWSTGGAALAYNDDACGLQSFVVWTAPSTGTVWVLADVYDCTWGITCGTLSVTQNTACIGGGAANDNCSGAISTTCGQTISNTTNGAAGDTFPGGCSVSTGAPGLWYSIVGTGQNITASLCGSGYDTQLSVFSGSCTGLSCVNFNDDYCGLASQVTFTGNTGTTYYILVFGYGSASGSFTLNITCQAPPTPTDQDCLGAITICNDQSFGGNSSGEGNYFDLNTSNQGCLDLAENQTSWYVFSPLTVGTIEFAITPLPVVDYDFAIWGPLTTVNCPPVGPPNWCSYSGLYANTGLAIWAGDYSESDLGDAWVSEIIITAAEVGDLYLMVLDNFSVTTTPFTFDWTLSGVTLDCSILLPVELVEFSGSVLAHGNLLQWTTATEHNNAHFQIQRSMDNVNFEVISTLEGSGNSLSALHYSSTDNYTGFGTIYYRLSQVDYNGTMTLSNVISLQRQTLFAVLSLKPNPAKTFLNLELYSSSAKQILLQWTDATGRKVSTSHLDIVPGQSSLTINVSHFKPGVYALQLTDGSQHIILERVCLE